MAGDGLIIRDPEDARDLWRLSPHLGDGPPISKGPTVKFIPHFREVPYKAAEQGLSGKTLFCCDVSTVRAVRVAAISEIGLRLSLLMVSLRLLCLVIAKAPSKRCITERAASRGRSFPTPRFTNHHSVPSLHTRETVSSKRQFRAALFATRYLYLLRTYTHVVTPAIYSWLLDPV